MLEPVRPDGLQHKNWPVVHTSHTPHTSSTHVDTKHSLGLTLLGSNNHTDHATSVMVSGLLVGVWKSRPCNFCDGLMKPLVGVWKRPTMPGRDTRHHHHHHHHLQIYGFPNEFHVSVHGNLR